MGRFGPRKVRIGDAQAWIDIDQGPLIDVLDRLYDGAVSSFLRRTTDILEPLQKAAQAPTSPWPVAPTRNGRQGGTSKRSFYRRQLVTETELINKLENTASNSWGFYTYKIRWSRRTADSLDREAAELGAETIRRTRRAKSPRAAARMRAHLYQQTFKTGTAAVWRSETGVNSSTGNTRWWRGQLTQKHGHGAPDARRAGKQPWRVMVRTPAMKEAKKLTTEISDDLSKLSGVD